MLPITGDALLHHLALCAILALVSAAIVRGMIAIRILDHPEARKAHAAPTPKGGGVGVVLAFLAGVLVLHGGAEHARLTEPGFLGVILAAAGIAAVALLDDLHDWPFTIKLGSQMLAALVAVAGGIWVRDVRLPGFGPVDLGDFGILATVFWVVLATNAVNFIDGLNGLAGGITLIACLFLAPIAAAHGSWFVYLAALVLAAGIAGFLPFNFPRARIFLGDVGSQFCGFVLAVFGIAAGRFGQTDLSFLIVPMLLSAALFDVIFTLLRRWWAGAILTQPHRGHIFQVAHRAGMSPIRITLVYWGLTVWSGAVCVLFLRAILPWYAGLIALLLPQLAWLAETARLARRAGIGRW